MMLIVTFPVCSMSSPFTDAPSGHAQEGESHIIPKWQQEPQSPKADRIEMPLSVYILSTLSVDLYRCKSLSIMFRADLQ